MSEADALLPETDWLFYDSFAMTSCDVDFEMFLFRIDFRDAFRRRYPTAQKSPCGNFMIVWCDDLGRYTVLKSRKTEQQCQ